MENGRGVRLCPKAGDLARSASTFGGSCIVGLSGLHCTSPSAFVVVALVAVGETTWRGDRTWRRRRRRRSRPVRGRLHPGSRRRARGTHARRPRRRCPRRRANRSPRPRSGPLRSRGRPRGRRLSHRRRPSLKSSATPTRGSTSTGRTWTTNRTTPGKATSAMSATHRKSESMPTIPANTSSLALETRGAPGALSRVRTYVLVYESGALVGGVLACAHSQRSRSALCTSKSASTPHGKGSVESCGLEVR